MQPTASVARFQTIRQLDSEWQHQRERFLDWGGEPQYPTIAAVLTTAAFFLIVFVASVALARPEWLYAAASVAIVVLYSYRARSFEAAYHDYLRRRSGELLAAR